MNRSRSFFLIVSTNLDDFFEIALFLCADFRADFLRQCLLFDVIFFLSVVLYVVLLLLCIVFFLVASGGRSGFPVRSGLRINKSSSFGWGWSWSCGLGLAFLGCGGS